MKATPRAITAGVEIRQIDGVFTLATAAGAVHQLPAVTAAIWQAADGLTDAAGLLAAARRVDATVTMGTVWQALDALADAGLLEHRAAPPSGAGLDRRAAIRTLVAAAGAAVAVLPGLARAADVKAGEQEVKSLRAVEEKTKAELTTIEARANEEQAKIASNKGDVAALKRSEQAAKAQVDVLRKRSTEETEKAVRKQEQNDKATGGTDAARNQEQNDKKAGLRNQEQNDKAK